MAMAEIRPGEVPAHLDSDEIENAGAGLLHEVGLAADRDVRPAPDVPHGDGPHGEGTIEGGFRLKGYGMPNILPMPTSAGSPAGEAQSPRWLKVPAAERLAPKLQQHDEAEDEGEAPSEGAAAAADADSDGAQPVSGAAGASGDAPEPYVILHSVPPIATGRAPISPPRLPARGLHAFHPAADDSIAEGEGEASGDDGYAAAPNRGYEFDPAEAEEEEEAAAEAAPAAAAGAPAAPGSWHTEEEEEQAPPRLASAAWQAAEAEEQQHLQEPSAEPEEQQQPEEEEEEEEIEQQQVAEEEEEPAAQQELVGAVEEEEEQQQYEDQPRYSVASAAAAFASAHQHTPTGTPQARFQAPARKMANPLGSSKGALMGMIGVNPDAEVIRASDVIEEVRAPPIKVTDMSKQLKEHFETGAALRRSDADDGEAPAANGQAPARGALAGLKQHDLVNTANVALLLQAGEFRLLPGVDVIPYAELKELRLEDGLDVSRKEEYLSEEEFEHVFGMDKEDFRAMPPWKRINAKKSKGLF